MDAPKNYGPAGIVSEPASGSAVCPIHGKFDFRCDELFGGRYIVRSCCPECLSEHAKAKLEESQRADEEKRKERCLERLIAAGIGRRHIASSFENYNAASEQQKTALRKCQSFCDAVITGQGAPNLIMSGSFGTGKTHLASAITAKAIKHGKRCKLIKLIDLIREIKDTWRKDSSKTERQVIDYYAALDVLIIDEIGVQFGSDHEKIVLFDILDGRYDNMLPVCLISNLDVNGIKEQVGERVVDRLREDGGQVVAFDWASHRGK